MHLAETPKKVYLSIYSTDLYRRVNIPIFGNQSIGREASGRGRRRRAARPAGPGLTNPPNWTKSTIFGVEICLAETPKKVYLSIYSTDLYWGGNILIFGSE